MKSILFASIMILSACAETTLNYKCTCTQIAYGANGDGSNVDRSFSENICDTYENVEAAFLENGQITKGLQTCETELSALSEEYECECDCYFQSEC